jgi:long-chain fatty acid transport protein
MEMELHRATRSLFASAALATFAAVAPATLHAQAFGLNEIGSCAVGRAFANTGSPCKDASTIFWNPAATTGLPGWTIAGGVAAIALDAGFTQDSTRRKWDSDVPTEWVPHVFVNYHNPSSKFAWGVGAYVPYGLTSEWTDDFPGRFSAKRASLKTIYVQPNVAYQITPNWSIGAGPIWGHSSVELIQGVDLAPFPTPAGVTFGQLGIASGTEFARVRLKGSDDAFGAQIGISGKFSNSWTVGARFLTPLEFEYQDGDVTFTQIPTNLVIGGTVQAPFSQGTPIDALVEPQFSAPNPLVSQTADTKITHPAQVQAGVAYSGFRDWLLEADYAWIGWKRFDVLPVTFNGPASGNSRVLIEDYNNSSAIRLGAEYTTAYSGLKVRAGFAGAASAAPPESVTPLLPEQDRNYWTLGFGWPVWSNWTVDGAFAHVSTGGSRGRIVERTTAQNATATAEQLNSGVFNLSANVFTITLKTSF